MVRSGACIPNMGVSKYGLGSPLKRATGFRLVSNQPHVGPSKAHDIFLTTRAIPPAFILNNMGKWDQLAGVEEQNWRFLPVLWANAFHIFAQEPSEVYQVKGGRGIFCHPPPVGRLFSSSFESKTSPSIFGSSQEFVGMCRNQ